jgi:N-acetylneuraminic acid mutarotase
VAGTWRKLAAAPIKVDASLTSVWTGSQMLVAGIGGVSRDGNFLKSFNVAAAYTPATGTWRRLPRPLGKATDPVSDPAAGRSVWTGKEMLVFGAFHSIAFDPAANRWRELRKTLPGGIIAWTGREAIGWGGGCCGDAWSNGAAYNAATGTYRNLPRSPLAPSQGPIGAWTGRELILFVSGFDPDGKPYPRRFARAAAYNPATNTWLRIAPLPATGLRFSGSAVWDGRELLVVGAGENAQSAYAYNLAANRWRRLTSMPSGRNGAKAVWTGTRLLVWGGLTGRDPARQADAGDGFAYDPRTDRWSTIPRWPLHARGGSAIAWTGRALIVWGGGKGVCKPGGVYGCHTEYFADGAAFTPKTP